MKRPTFNQATAAIMSVAYFMFVTFYSLMPDLFRLLTWAHGGFILMFGVVVINVHRRRVLLGKQAKGFGLHIWPVFLGTSILVMLVCHTVLGNLGKPPTFYSPLVTAALLLLDYGLIQVLKYSVRQEVHLEELVDRLNAVPELSPPGD